MTPAEELGAAADNLYALVERAAPDWRIDADNFLAMPMIETPFMIGPFKDDPSKTFGLVGPNDATTVYLWAMRPLVGKALAEALHADAKRIRDSTLVQPFYKGDASLLKVARLINGGDS